MMKLALRAFALTVVVAGLFAASVSSGNAKTVASHQVTTAGLPVPFCYPDPCEPLPPPKLAVR